jgi:catalase-peroxidase
MTTESKCPVLGGSHRHTAVGATAHQHWWPNQLNLKALHQKSPQSDPMGEEFNYAEEFKTLDLDALKGAIEAEIQLLANWVSRGHRRYYAWSVLHSASSLAMDQRKTLTPVCQP